MSEPTILHQNDKQTSIKPGLSVPYNPNEQSGKNYLSTNVKIWVIIPMLSFHGLGLVVLLCLAYHFSHNEPNSDYLWPALVAGLLILMFSFTISINKLVDAIITNTK